MTQLNLLGGATITPEEYSKAALAELEEKKRKENAHLYKWRDYIKDLAARNEQEVVMWFDTSAPYDDEINVNVVGHRCTWTCINFRFDKGMLQAYDSHFGGGTSWCRTENDEQTAKTISELMQKVFDKQCHNNPWAEKSTVEEAAKRIANIQKCIKPDGWVDRDKYYDMED